MKPGKIFNILQSAVAMLFLCLLSLPTFAKTTSVGQLYYAANVVPDINQAVQEWQSGTGNQFNPVTSSTFQVRTPNGNGTYTTQSVTLQRAFSVRNAPFVELVQATPAVGPWQPAWSVGAPGFLGYVVDDVQTVGNYLTSSYVGMVEVANEVNYAFAVYQARNGVLIELIQSSLVPGAGGTNVSQAAIDLGAVVHTDIAVQQYIALQSQMGRALSTLWVNIPIPVSPFYFAGQPEPVNCSSKIAASVNRPQVQLEKVTPSLGVFAATHSNMIFHVAYRAPAGSMNLVNSQMLAAGFSLSTWAEAPLFGMILAYYVSPNGNYWIEIVDANFDIPPSV